METLKEQKATRTVLILTGIGINVLSNIIPYFWASLAITTIAVIVIILGFLEWAKIKSRSGWYALFGLLWPLGLIVLALLKDKSQPQETSPK